jgi:hypothetical protein
MEFKTHYAEQGSTAKLVALPMVVALTALLSGCGGGSNNLPDPGTGSTPLSTCTTTTAATCVTSQFIVDGPVVGLNYNCGIVSSVTDNTGTVSCQDRSVATFFIQSADGKKKITLGSVLIRANSDVSRQVNNDLTSITPLSLITTSRSATSLEDTNANGAVYISQLLETLRSASSPFNPDEPTSRLILDSKTLTALNLLSGDVSQSEAATPAYITKLQPVFDNLKVTLTTIQETTKRLTQGLNALQAGVYYTPNFTATLPGIANNIGTVGLSSNDNNVALLSLHNLIDRSGHVIGQGVEWFGSILPDVTNGAVTPLNLQTKKDSLYTRLVLTGINSPVTTPDVNLASFLNPVSDFMTSKYIWQPQAVKLEDNGDWTKVPGTPLSDAVFTNGRLIGGTYVVGNDQLWQNVSNLTTPTSAPLAELASWKQGLNGTDAFYKGSLTLNKTRSVSTFLDPAVIKTAANVGKGNQGIFPLHAVLTFTKLAGCTSSCTLGSVPISILTNGDIITDMNQQCLAVNPDTMKNTADVQQYRIGTLAAAFQGITNVTDRFISPIIMLSGPQFGALDGIQIGTLSLGVRAKINIVGVPNGNIHISDNTTTSTHTGEQSTDAAVYINFYDVWNAQKVNSTSQTADDIVTKRSLGTVSIKLSSCYTPPPGV